MLDSASEKVADGADANRHSNTVSMQFTPSDGRYYSGGLSSGVYSVELCDTPKIGVGSQNHCRTVPLRHPAPDYTFSVAEMVKVSFGEAAYSVNEQGSTSVGIPVTLSHPVQETLIPIIVTQNGGATGGDYEVSHEKAYFGTLKSMTITVYAKDDSDNDDGESITLSFGTLPDGFMAGTNATTTITIVDNDS